MRRRFTTITYFALLIFGIYLAITLPVYEFKHPEQTDTQRLLNIPRALVWR